MILNAEGQPKTPSLVHFADNDETLVGEPVENLLQDVSTDRVRRDDVFRRTVSSIKRNLLSPPRIALPGGRYVRPVDVAAEILRKIKGDVEDGHFHEEVKRAVITCPAEFNVLQRRRIEEAGSLAGFSEVVLLEEPVAGALAYARAGLDVGQHVLVYDLGGGTFDLAVLDGEGESFHVAMEPKGVERCGGDDFDLALYHHCDEVARETLGRPISLTGSVDLSFLRACRRRKESLTFSEKGRFNSYLSSENGPVYFEHEVDRRTFEDLIVEYVETSARLTAEILAEADGAGHEVDTVVLVGGSVRVPLVVQRLSDTLPVSPLGFDKRDVAVALGAAHFTEIQWAAKSATVSAPLPPSKPSNTERYGAAVEEVRGKRIGKVEAERLSALAAQLGVSGEEAREIEVRILGSAKEEVLVAQYRRAVEAAWADGNLSPLEAEWLEATAGDMGVGEREASRIETGVMGDAKENVLARRPPAPAPKRGDFVLEHTLSGHVGEVRSAAFTDDGLFLASGGVDHAVRGWDAIEGRSVGVLHGHSGAVLSVAFGAGGDLLASAGSDKTVRLWKLPNGEPFGSLAHPDWVFSIAVSLDGKTLVSGCADGKIRVWNLDSGAVIGDEPLHSTKGHSHWVLCVAVGADGLVASGGADGFARVWNLDDGEEVIAFEEPGWVRCVALGGDFLVTGGEDGTVRARDILGDGNFLYSVVGHSGAVRCVALGGDFLVTGGEDGKVKVWDLRTGEPLSILDAHAGGVSSVAASLNGVILATGGKDGDIKVWRKSEEIVSGEDRERGETDRQGIPEMPESLPD